MKYTEYTWRTDILTRSFKREVMQPRLGFPKAILKQFRKMSRADKVEFLRVNSFANEFLYRLEMLSNEEDDERGKLMLNDTVLTLSQLNQEDDWREGSREMWYPETEHLLEVLARVEMNAHPDELFTGESVTRMIHVPEGFEMEGYGIRSMLVTLQTGVQKMETMEKFIDRYEIPEALKIVRTQGKLELPRIFLSTCDREDFFVADFNLEEMSILLKGNLPDTALRCITPYDYEGLVPTEAFESQDVTRTRVIAHFNLALRLMIYAQAFPEVLVDFIDKPAEPGKRRIRKKRLVTHRRIRKDPDTVRFVTHRRGYTKRAHEKTLRAARFKRNPDGSPRVVPVKECWVPPIGYIGGQKKTVKELEAEAIRSQQSST